MIDSIIFPENSNGNGLISEDWKIEEKAAKEIGLNVLILPISFYYKDIFQSELNVIKQNEKIKTVYHGWQITKNKYDQLLKLTKDLNIDLIPTSSENYSSCHYFKNWYSAIKNLNT